MLSFNVFIINFNNVLSIFVTYSLTATYIIKNATKQLSFKMLPMQLERVSTISVCGFFFQVTWQVDYGNCFKGTFLWKNGIQIKKES